MRRSTAPHPTVTTEQPSSSSNTHNNEGCKSPPFSNKGKGNCRRLPQLPPEIILLVLQQLPWSNHQPTLHACTVVNKMFYSTINPLLWNKPTLPSATNVQRLLTCLDLHASQDPGQTPGQHIRQLRLHGNFVTDAHLQRLLPLVPQLTSLELSCSTQLTATSIQWIPHHCQHLMSLHLESITLTPSILTSMGQYCRQFQKLFLGNCTMRQPNMFMPLVQHCPLKDLTMMNCHMHGNEETTFMDIIHCHHLTSLYLSGLESTMNQLLLLAAAPTTTTSPNTNTAAATAAATTTTTHAWPHLAKFVTRDGLGIDDRTWISFFKSHPQLREISLGDAFGLTDDSLDAMGARWLPHLTHVRVIDNKKITPAGVRRWIQNASSCLVSVELIHCDRLQKHDFPDLVFPAVFNHRIKLDETDIGRMRGTNKAQMLE
ncbi:hypothetical protein BCR42DRAFT_397372 [Absidia repens]|uniref:Uncharacterized protein n=1 Tax=Absidia repens TaxID=90262 RepID=A0A1X2I096_9FUNG|nr:hypothetical protein BCR42DRAFT_443261 [Absidia repens]ORZ07473.1 hypothetical protein BCR42DRAFT_397372 [Absidia repens]